MDFFPCDFFTVTPKHFFNSLVLVSNPAFIIDRDNSVMGRCAYCMEFYLTHSQPIFRQLDTGTVMPHAKYAGLFTMQSLQDGCVNTEISCLVRQYHFELDILARPFQVDMLIHFSPISDTIFMNSL